MRRLLVAAVVFIAFATLTACGGSSAPAATITPGPSVSISFGGGANLQVEIADTSAERAVGLMHRTSLGDDSGMLFAFPSDTEATFYMKDTLVPLTVAFVKADGTIVHFEDMEPQTETRHHSSEPYRYAIEANLGWFAAHGVAVGGNVTVPAGIVAS